MIEINDDLFFCDRSSSLSSVWTTVEKPETYLVWEKFQSSNQNECNGSIERARKTDYLDTILDTY